MNRHPGGEAHTETLLEAAGLKSEARILDMGAGDGSGVRLLKRHGYEAMGIDLKPGSPEVQQGDFLCSGFPEESFDGILSQCAFYISGNQEGAFCESARILRKRGLLLFSDVWFGDERELRKSLEHWGFRIRFLKDLTAEWKEYYIEGIWKGTIEPGCMPKGRCRYFAAVAEKK